jgi:ATP-dependent protease ClpP protease subunit
MRAGDNSGVARPNGSKLNCSASGHLPDIEKFVPTTTPRSPAPRSATSSTSAARPTARSAPTTSAGPGRHLPPRPRDRRQRAADTANAHVVEDLVDINFGPTSPPRGWSTTRSAPASPSSTGSASRRPQLRRRPREVPAHHPHPRRPRDPLARADRLQSPAALANALGARNGARPRRCPRREGTTSAELWLYGVVGGYWWGFNDKTVADQLRGLNVDQITVRLNSPGGDAIQGIAIGNLFRNHKANVTVVVDGLAASAASIIAIAGDEVVMSPGSQMMIHDPWFFTMGNAKELRQDADFLDKQGANMAGVYALRAGGTAETWRAAMTADARRHLVHRRRGRRPPSSPTGSAPSSPSAPPPSRPRSTSTTRTTTMAAARRLGPRGPHHPGRPRRLERRAAPKPPTASADGSTQPKEVLPWRSATSRSPPCGRSSAGRVADEATIVAALDEALVERAEAPPAPPPRRSRRAWRWSTATCSPSCRPGAAAAASGSASVTVTPRSPPPCAPARSRPTPATTGPSSGTRTPPAPRPCWTRSPSGLVPTAEVGHESEPNALGDGIEISDAEMDAFASSLGMSKEALRG